jgi:hypothetical protein
VTQDQFATPSDPQSEIAYLQEELQVRDQLVQQLSQELFRLVKGNASFVDPPHTLAAGEDELNPFNNPWSVSLDSAVNAQEQEESHVREVHQLRQTVQELTDRCRLLEQAIQEFPEIYRQKFTERMQLVKERIMLLQQENRCLKNELHSTTHRLMASKQRSNSEIDLPKFPQFSASS